MSVISIIILVFFGILIGLFLFGVVFLKISVLHDTVGRSEVTYRDTFSNEYKDFFAWFDRLKSEGHVHEQFITNKDGLKLQAYFIPKENAIATAILVHGYSGCALQTLPQARMYRDQFGYNLILVNLAHHAQSEGNITTMGWKDRLDVMQWIEMALTSFDSGAELPIVLHGLSMGGSTVLMTAGERLPKNVKAVINDSGYTSAFAEFDYEIKTKLHLPTIPFTYAADWVSKLVLGWSYREASALKQMHKIEIPVLIIHGDADTRVPLSESKRLYDAKSEGYKNRWVVPGGKHIKAILQYPIEYERRIKEFLQLHKLLNY